MEKLEQNGAVIEMSVLGELSLHLGDNAISDKTGRSMKLWSVLCYIMFHRQRLVTQSELIEVFWPDEDASSPLSALKMLVMRIRSTLKPLVGEENDPILGRRVQELSGFLGNCEHFFRFFGVHRHRLFADNICTAAESSDGRTLVRGVPRRDAYAVEVFLRHHFVVVGVGTRDVVAFRIPLQLCFVNVACRNDFHAVRQCQITAHMRIADAAGTDDTNLDLFHEIPPYDRFFLSYCQRLYHNRRNLSIF